MNNNNNPKRPRGWSNYYARQNKKDRHEALDSSAAKAINAGPQPTLARRRRQLADDRWESNSKKEKNEQDIFQDLLKSHQQGTQPIALMRSRKHFWKRSLSNLSTKDFDEVWAEGRNRFFCQAIFLDLSESDRTRKELNQELQDCDLHSSMNKPIIDSKKVHWKKAWDGSNQSFDRVWAQGRNEFIGEQMFQVLLQVHNKQKAKPKKICKSAYSDLSAEDFEDAWKKGLIKFHKHQASKKAAKKAAKKQHSDVTNEGNLVGITNTAPAQSTTTNTSGTTSINRVNQTTDTLGNNNDHDVIDLCDSDSEESNVEDKEDTNHSAKSSAPIISRAKHEAAEELQAADPVIASVSSRWSKFFLGPDFRAENIFSLDDEECF